MGIDRIGKGGGPTSAPPTAGTERSEKGAGGEASRAFEVRPAATSATAASSAGTVQGVAPAGASPLERLRTGEIDLDRYLDLKVDQATAHVKGLGAREMEGLRTMLRAQLSGDPSLVDLVAQATGQRPAPKE